MKKSIKVFLLGFVLMTAGVALVYGGWETLKCFVPFWKLVSGATLFVLSGVLLSSAIGNFQYAKSLRELSSKYADRVNSFR